MGKNRCVKIDDMKRIIIGEISIFFLSVIIIGGIELFHYILSRNEIWKNFQTNQFAISFFAISTTIYVLTFNALTFINKSSNEKFFITGKSLRLDYQPLGIISVKWFYISGVSSCYLASFFTLIICNYVYAFYFSILTILFSSILIIFTSLVIFEKNDALRRVIFNELYIDSIDKILMKYKIHLIIKEIKDRNIRVVINQETKKKEINEKNEIKQMINEFEQYGFEQTRKSIKKTNRFLIEEYELCLNNKSRDKDLHFIAYYLKHFITKLPFLSRIYFIQNIFSNLKMVCDKLYEEKRYYLLLELLFSCFSLFFVTDSDMKTKFILTPNTSNKIILIYDLMSEELLDKLREFYHSYNIEKMYHGAYSHESKILNDLIDKISTEETI